MSGTRQFQIFSSKGQTVLEAIELCDMPIGKVPSIYVIEKTAADKLFVALEGIIDIGKRDMTNPKYDGFFNTAKDALANYRGVK